MMEAFLKGKVGDGIVLFAGAGCSMAPPSSLPGWNSLNDSILASLWDRLEPFGLNNRFREIILGTIKRKRKENSFPPDYQAQRMVERVGIEYFQLLSAVDSDSYNATQYYAALLAKSGLLKAVITTNFDRNFERAFSLQKVPFNVCYDEKGFNSLALSENSGDIPIIKIHGCCSSPESMVDTRKQRLQGRAESLEKVMLQLLRKHHFVFGGFSGQDLDDNKNYLGLRDAASFAKGFTFLYRSGSSVRKSIMELIEFYGTEKASAIEYDVALFIEQLLKSSKSHFALFSEEKIQNQLSIEAKLKLKVADLEPMDAINMLTALAESYGDEISARYIYDKVWRNRNPNDYKGDALSRFLLNHGRSYVFNFQEKKERASNAGIAIEFYSSPDDSSNLQELFTNPAKRNLSHSKNTSPETLGLIGLVQTYVANPILFKDFPKNFVANLQSQPDKTEQADIYYYYSFYALIHNDINGIKYLNSAVYEMEQDCDEPRLSQLLSRRGMLKLRINHPDRLIYAMEDIKRARDFAEKYQEPHLLALSALASANFARNELDFQKAFEYIQEAETNYFELKRIPQYIECIVEYLKIIQLGLQVEETDKVALLKIVSDIKAKVETVIVERIPVFEPDYCYQMGMIYKEYTDSPHEQVLPWFIDAVSLAAHFNQEGNYNYYRETCKLMNILDEVDQRIAAAKKGQ